MTKWRSRQDIEVLEGIHLLRISFQLYIRISIYWRSPYNRFIMPGIPQVFLLCPATILMPIIGSTSPISPMSNNGPYITQLSLFACLIIVGLFLILVTLSLSSAFFLFYTRGIRQPLYSPQELVWFMRHKKWLERVMRLLII